jgi:dipeptidyl aminopeptidase/acylaminoacyl peptidase
LPEKINTLILILHGEANRRMNVTQAKKLAAKIKELDKTYKSVIYSGESHMLEEYSKIETIEYNNGL